jgi:hypothetical protein
VIGELDDDPEEREPVEKRESSEEIRSSGTAGGGRYPLSASHSRTVF